MYVIRSLILIVHLQMRHLRRSRGDWGRRTSQGLEHLLIDFGCEKLDKDFYTLPYALIGER